MPPATESRGGILANARGGEAGFLLESARHVAHDT